MSSKRPPSDLADKFMLRLPDGMRDRIATAAKEGGRSMNAEIITRLEDSLDPRRLPVLQIELGSQEPISWAEIHEHLQAFQKSARVSAVELRVQIFTPELLSSQGREEEAESLRSAYARPKGYKRAEAIAGRNRPKSAK